MTAVLERAMLRQRIEHARRLERFGARGPATPLARPLRLFGRLVGDGEIFAPESGRLGRPLGPDIGGVPFAWALGGTAVVDVWGPLEPATDPTGTTVRSYDPGLRAGRGPWLSPNRREVRSFVGRPRRGEVVLEEKGGGGERRVFFALRRSSFRWRAERRAHGKGRGRSGRITGCGGVVPARRAPAARARRR